MRSKQALTHLIGLLLLTGILFACRAASDDVATPQEVTSVVERTPAIPTTPPCTDLPSSMSLDVVPLSHEAVCLSGTGFEPGKPLTIELVSESSAGHSRQTLRTWHTVEPEPPDGRFDSMVDNLPPTLGIITTHLQVNVIDDESAVCQRVTLSPAGTPTSISPSPEPGAPAILFFHDQALWRTGTGGREPEKLTDKVPLMWTREGSGHAQLWRIALGIPPRVSPDGRWLAANDLVSMPRTTWWLFDVTGQADPTPLHCGAELQRTNALPTWSPDSQRYACIRDDVLYVHEVHNQYGRMIFEQDGLEPAFTAWSPDDRYLATGSITCEQGTAVCQGEVWVSDLQQGNSWLVGEFNPPLEAAPGALAWFPESERVFVDGSPDLILSTRDHTRQPLNSDAWSPDYRYGVRLHPQPAEVFQADGSVLYTLPQDDSCRYAWGDWSPDRVRLVYVGHCELQGTEVTSSILHVLDVETGELPWERELPGLAIYKVLWSVDGQYLLVDQFDSPGGTSPIWYLRADGTGEIGVLVEEGFLLDVVRQWE